MYCVIRLRIEPMSYSYIGSASTFQTRKIDPLINALDTGCELTLQYAQNGCQEQLCIN